MMKNSLSTLFVLDTLKLESTFTYKFYFYIVYPMDVGVSYCGLFNVLYGDGLGDKT